MSEINKQGFIYGGIPACWDTKLQRRPSCGLALATEGICLITRFCQSIPDCTKGKEKIFHPLSLFSLYFRASILSHYCNQSTLAPPSPAQRRPLHPTTTSNLHLALSAIQVTWLHFTQSPVNSVVTGGSGFGGEGAMPTFASRDRFLSEVRSQLALDRKCAR